MGINKFFSILESVSPIKIRKNLCSRIISPRSSCTNCVKTCPTSSITINSYSIEVNKCSYCGLCSAICPNQAFYLEEDSLLYNSKNQNPLILTCRRYLQSLKINNNISPNVNCLWQLYPELLLKLLANSQKVVVLVNQEICDCCLKFDYTDLNKNLFEFKNIFEDNLLVKLRIINTPKEVELLISSLIKEESINSNRRHFFKSIFSSSKVLPQKAVNTTLENITGEIANQASNVNQKQNTAKRKRYISEILAKLSVANTLEALPYQKLVLSNCNFCGACSKLCPTQALQISQEENSKTITYHPARCNECKLCTDICFFKGLSWFGQVTIEEFISKQPLVLGRSAEKTCEKCKETFWNSSDNKLNSFRIVCEK